MLRGWRRLSPWRLEERGGRVVVVLVGFLPHVLRAPAELLAALGDLYSIRGERSLAEADAIPLFAAR